MDKCDLKWERILLLVVENMRDIDNAIIIISSTWVLSNNDGDDDQ